MTDSPSSILLLRIQSVGSNTNLWGGYLRAAAELIGPVSLRNATAPSLAAL